MAWITPVTDRVQGAMHTVTDQNRIAQNLDWLATELTTYQLYTGATVQKTTYTKNDYITVDDWADILSVLNAMIEALALETEGTADDSTTYMNMNTVESLTLAIYDRLQLLLSQANLNHYAGDSIYTEGPLSIYSGGLAI